MLDDIYEEFKIRIDPSINTTQDLCALCKKLSVANINRIGGGYSMSLKKWYLDHLMKDYEHNKDAYPQEAQISINEMERLGYKAKIKYVYEPILNKEEA